MIPHGAYLHAYNCSANRVNGCCKSLQAMGFLFSHSDVRGNSTQQHLYAKIYGGRGGRVDTKDRLDICIDQDDMLDVVLPVEGCGCYDDGNDDNVKRGRLSATTCNKLLISVSQTPFLAPCIGRCITM